MSSLCVLISFSDALTQQVVPEYIFTQQGGIEVSLDDRRFVEELVKHHGITIDHGSTREVPKLYVTKEGYDHLTSQNIKHTYHPRPPSQIRMKGPVEISKSHRSMCMPAMDFYPTYEGYIEMMYAFQDMYPDLCSVYSIGPSVNSRELLMIQIGDDPGSIDDEPKFLYTSTMHGDETGGFVMMLQLIDYLLCNYDSDARVRNLVDEVTIFINPLANPDGLYTFDNSTIVGATRRNANFIDINRNFPDPKAGTNPDNRPTQPETQAFLDFARNNKIDMSCNFHGGDEVVNYPWDTWEKRHADDSWWIEKCTAYAESCHEHGPADYMRDRNNGVTNGWDWYELVGGRQDQMIYYERGREITIELTEQRILDADKLPVVWEANREALLGFMEETLYGLRGVVRDCDTGMPIRAEVFIDGHDKDNSSIFSDSMIGNYFRYLDDGEYVVSYAAEGYDTLERTVVIMDKVSTVQDVELCKTISGIDGLAGTTISIYLIGDDLKIEGLESNKEFTTEIFSVDGQLLQTYTRISVIDISHLDKGAYIARISVGDENIARPFIKE